MLLYLLIGSGMSLSLDWADAAQAVGTSSKPAMSAFEIMGASLIFMMLCWQIPKLFAAVLGGSPALSGGDLVAAGGTVATGAIVLATAAVAAAGAVAGAAGAGAGAGAGGGGGASAGAGAGGGSGMSMMSAGSGASVPPPSAASSGGGSSAASQPDPPSQSSVSPVMDAARSLKDIGRRLGGSIPSDAAPHTPPPRMNLDHHE
jgi:type IV secretory pathway TrbL component